MKKAHLFSLIGLLIGTGAPLGALLLRLFSSPLSWNDFLFREWAGSSFFYDYMLLGTCLAFSLFGYFIGGNTDQLLHKEGLLAQEVLTDPLTGLGNHRFLHDTFKIEFRRHRDEKRPISCLMLDLDHFKRINDNYGHPFGDLVLKQFSSLLRRSIRTGDTAARYGGEEFLCILPHCDKEQARAVAERVRWETERHVFAHGKKKVRATVSLGVVTSYESSGLNYRQLIALSDQALYEAKKKGRNQAVQTTLGLPLTGRPRRGARSGPRPGRSRKGP